MRMCSKCGSNVNAAAKFCVKCGNPMGGTGYRPSPRHVEGYGMSTLAKGQKKNSVFKIVAAVVLIVVAYVVFFDGGRGIYGTWELISVSGMTEAEFREELRRVGGFARTQINRDNTGAWIYGTGERFEFDWRIQNGMLITTELGRRPVETPFSVSRNRLTIHERGSVYVYRRR